MLLHKIQVLLLYRMMIMDVIKNNNDDDNYSIWKITMAVPLLKRGIGYSDLFQLSVDYHDVVDSKSEYNFTKCRMNSKYQRE